MQFTLDFNPGNLTSFLYKDLQFDPDGGAFGGVVGKVSFLLPYFLPASPLTDSLYLLS